MRAFFFTNRLIGIFALLLLAASGTAQDKKGPYDHKAEAKSQIQDAVAKAKKESKHVLLQIGGNWCGWCLKLEDLYRQDKEIAAELDKSYVLAFINYSKENKNLPVLAELGHPQRFGFPALVVLDDAGARLHTQNTAYLEEGKAYNPKRVLEALRSWSPAALDPKLYR